MAWSSGSASSAPGRWARDRPARVPGPVRDLPPRPGPRGARGGRRRDCAQALAKGAERGRWSAGEAEAAAARLREAPRLEDLAGCELVIEAAPEDLELKRELFAGLAEVCGARGDPRHQHLLPVGDRDRRRSRAARAGRRHALLQPAGADAAGRGRRRRARRPSEALGDRRRGRAGDGPRADPRRRRDRLRRQPARPPVHAGGAADARRGGRRRTTRSTASCGSAAASAWARSS